MYDQEFEEMPMSQFEQLFRQREAIIDIARIISELRIEMERSEPNWVKIYDIVTCLDNGLKSSLDHTIP